MSTFELQFSPVNSESTALSVEIEASASSPADALRSLLDLGETVTQRLATIAPTDGTAGVAYSARADDDLVRRLGELHAKAREEFVLDLQSPFEGTELIAGAVWHGHLVDPERCDALVSLEWSPRCSALPAHTHDYSDRFIFIPSGQGTMYTSVSDAGSAMEITVRLSSGSIVAFTRGVKHTFGTQSEGMEMLSYHVPFVSLENRRQYTVLSPEWLPAASPG